MGLKLWLVAIDRPDNAKATGLSWPMPADLLVEPPKAEVAIGREGTHPQLLGHVECLAVGALCLLRVERLGMGGDLSK